jgi:putative hydrolase of the HAD superfamily
LHHQAHLDGIEYPEVEIRDVWGAVIGRAAHAGIIDVHQGRSDIERFTIEYECSANPFWPMPGAFEVIEALRSSTLDMGIVSNAQFYTPLAMEALFGSSLESLGFAPRFCIFSFECGRAKPGTDLFVRVLENLAKDGISPAQALYVGNDMLKDIWPASRLGMKTCLFAGDRRSLRLRQSDPRCEELRPDVVITRMTQLLKVVGLRPD